MHYSSIKVAALAALLSAGTALPAYAQMPESSTYDIDMQKEIGGMKINFLTSPEEAFKQAKKQKKLIFVTLFQDWAVPCHGMNSGVFSDPDFGKYMNKNFVNLFINADTSDGQDFAKKYNVKTYAHALVLDKDGNLIMRIVGGSKLPNYQEEVALSLSPKTSLAGTQASYEAGKRDKETLVNYLRALSMSNDDAKYKEVAPQYFALLKPEEYADKKNWEVVKTFITDRSSQMYDYLVQHKADFVKSNGKDMVDGFLAGLFMQDAMNYAMGNTPYSVSGMDSLKAEMDVAQLPEDIYVRQFWTFGKLRGEKRYAEMLDYLKAHDKEWYTMSDNLRSSLNIPGLNEADRKLISDYLNAEADKMDQNGQTAKRTRALAAQVSNTAGIKFENGTFAEALAKAKAENKMLFLDCFTSWCGPCKMMANQVFTQPIVGDYFKTRFIAIKIDMEKGEGINLAKKYKVAAYPTMLVLDGDGTINARIVGARAPQQFVQALQKLTNPETGYKVAKAAYESGKINGDVIKNYCFAMTNSGEMTEESAQNMMDGYLKKLTNADFAKKENWGIISDAAEENPAVRNKIFKLYKQITAAAGNTEVDKTIERITFINAIDAFEGKAKTDSVKALFKQVQNIGYPADYSLPVLNKLFNMNLEKNSEGILNCYENEVANMKNAFSKLNLDVLIHYFMKDMNDAQKQRVLTYVSAQAEKAEPRAQRKYGELMSYIQSLVAKKDK